MGKNATRACLLAASILTLAACSLTQSPPLPNPNLFPTDYKKEVADTMHKLLGDFMQVRAAYISDPAIAQADSAQRYTLCVRVDWHNIANNATGTGDRIAYFYAGHLSQLVDAPGNECSKAAYKPFPELQKL
jgi:hypothetical protein